MARQPRAVRQQEKQAEALMRGERPPLEVVSAEPELASSEPLAGPAEPAEPTPAEPTPAEPTPAEPTPAEPAEPAPAPQVSAPALPTDPESALWEQRYRTLEGKYAAETARMRADLEALQARAEQPAPLPVSDMSASDADDVETYGKDFLDMIDRRTARVASQVASRLVQEAVAAFAPKLEKVATESSQTRLETVQARMHRQLGEQIPNWRDINVDPAFHSWLAQPDRVSGVQRSTLLTTAFNSGRVGQVVAIFEAFRDSTTTPAVPLPAPAPRTRQPGRDPLADLAAPGQTRTASPGVAAPTQPQPVPTSLIRQFYLDVSKGAYKNAPEEQARVEALIVSAVANGHVIQDTNP